EIFDNPLPPVSHHSPLGKASRSTRNLHQHAACLNRLTISRMSTWFFVPVSVIIHIYKDALPFPERCDAVMCGRFLLTTPANQLAGLFQFTAPDDEETLSPRFNIAPTQSIVTVRNEQGDGRELARSEERREGK